MFRHLSTEEAAERREDLWRRIEPGSVVDYLYRGGSTGMVIRYGIVQGPRDEAAETVSVIHLSKENVKMLLKGTLPASIRVHKADLSNLLN